MNPVFIAVTRREYVHVGSAPASLLETVTATNTEFMPQENKWDRCVTDRIDSRIELFPSALRILKTVKCVNYEDFHSFDL